MTKRYSAEDQPRINEMRNRLRELGHKPRLSAENKKEIKEMGEEIKRIELRNLNNNVTKIARLY